MSGDLSSRESEKDPDLWMEILPSPMRIQRCLVECRDGRLRDWRALELFLPLEAGGILEEDLDFRRPLHLEPMRILGICPILVSPETRT